MARIPVSEERVRTAILQLQAENTPVTVTTVRAKVGSGSFTTIGTMLAAWKNEQTQAERVPQVPDRLQPFFHQVWQEAWKDAARLFDAEKKRMEDEKASLQRDKDELAGEVSRLETQVSSLAEELEQTKDANATLSSETKKAAIALAREQTEAEMLRQELKQAKAELKEVRVELSSWIERGSKAEAAIKKSKAA